MSIIVKSGVPGKVPTSAQLEYGQLALNYADQKIYFKNSANQLTRIPAISINGSGYNVDASAIRMMPWTSAYSTIQFGMTTLYSGHSTPNGSGFANNAYYDNVAWRYQSSVGGATILSPNNGGMSLRIAAPGTVDALVTWNLVLNTVNYNHLLLGLGAEQASTQTGTTLANGIATYEEGGKVKTVERTGAANGPINTVQIDITGGLDGVTYGTQIDLFGYLGKHVKYQHNVYKANTWIDYGATAIQNIVSAGVAVAYTSPAVGTLRFTITGLANAYAVGTCVKIIIATGGAAPSPTITFTYS